VRRRKRTDRLINPLDALDALALRPDHAPTLYNRGCTYRHTGQLDVALADFTRALELHPDDPRALNNRGLALHGLGRDC